MSIKKSRLLCYYLRHKPEEINLKLDENGFGDTTTLLKALNITLDKLIEIVYSDNCGRYSFRDNSCKDVRANYGHSVGIGSLTSEVLPPVKLYHGSAKENIHNIMKEGILPMGRDTIHLTNSIDKAISNGSRHGTPIVFTLDCLAMCKDDYIFRMPGKCIWTVEKRIDIKYILETNEFKRSGGVSID